MIDKKDIIKESAINLFTERGFYGTPTSLIAKVSGVANGTLFHYFKTKEELINALYISAKEELFVKGFENIDSEQSVKGKMKLLFQNTIKWASDNRNKFLFIQQFANSPLITNLTKEEMTRYHGSYTDLIAEGIRNSEISERNPELIMYLLTYQIFGVIHFIFENEKYSSDSGLLEKTFDICWNSISK